jgi:hypothetical protein
VHFFCDVSLRVKEMGYVGYEHLNIISWQQMYELDFTIQNGNPKSMGWVLVNDQIMGNKLLSMQDDQSIGPTWFILVVFGAKCTILDKNCAICKYPPPVSKHKKFHFC